MGLDSSFAPFTTQGTSHYIQYLCYQCQCECCQSKYVRHAGGDGNFFSRARARMRVCVCVYVFVLGRLRLVLGRPN